MKRVLIIDDEERIRMLYTKLFVTAGILVRQAGDARQATNIMIREDLDLVILDIKMPGVDGKTMHEIIKEYNPALKVIISSVYPVDKQKAIIPCAWGYYDKSQGPVVLLEKISKVLFPNLAVLAQPKKVVR